MDIMEKVNELVEAITGNEKLMAQFNSDPVKAIKGLLTGLDLDEDDLKKLAKAVEGKINIDKASVLYDFLDNSKMFRSTVEKKDRSLMNVPFVSTSPELDAEVVAATKAAGYDNLKGHKSVGGLRASTYNAMPKEGVEALVACLKQFEAEHK